MRMLRSGMVPVGGTEPKVWELLRRVFLALCVYLAFLCLWIAGLLYRQEESETGEEDKEGRNRDSSSVYDWITCIGVCAAGIDFSLTAWLYDGTIVLE